MTEYEVNDMINAIFQKTFYIWNTSKYIWNKVQAYKSGLFLPKTENDEAILEVFINFESQDDVFDELCRKYIDIDPNFM